MALESKLSKFKSEVQNSQVTCFSRMCLRACSSVYHDDSSFQTDIVLNLFHFSAWAFVWESLFCSSMSIGSHLSNSKSLGL